MHPASSSTLGASRRPAQHPAALAYLQPKGIGTWSTAPSFSLFVGASAASTPGSRYSATSGVYPTGSSTRTSQPLTSYTSIRAGVAPGGTSTGSSGGCHRSSCANESNSSMNSANSSQACSTRAASPNGRRGPDVCGPVGVEGGDGTAPLAVARGKPAHALVEDTTAGNWRMPLRRPGSVVALGKFDALHRGHQALAAAAAALARELAVQRSAAAAAAATTPSNSVPSPTTSESNGASYCCNGSASDSGGSPTPFAVHQPPTTSLPSTPAAASLPSSAATPQSPASAPFSMTPPAAAGSGNDSGEAVLLSFSGMGAVLGWPNRLPLTAPQDRGRVLAGWGPECAGEGKGRPRWPQAAQPEAEAPPRLRTMPFSLIRGMSPEQFVELLAKDLGAAGVVAGRNYRFGYKAAGDAETLVRLGWQYGMHVEIVDLVMLPDNGSPNGSVAAYTTNSTTGTACEDGSTISTAPRTSEGGDCAAVDASATPMGLVLGRSHGASRGSNDGAEAAPLPGTVSTDLEVDVLRPLRPISTAAGAASGSGSGGGGDGCSRVSSSRIRALLEQGQVERVEQLLGRKYRLVCVLASASTSSSSDEDGSTASESGERGAGRVLAVPYAAYQNQPPANGQYRALVRIVTSAEVPVLGDADVASGTSTEFASGADSALYGSNTIQYACTLVTLSETGLEVIMPNWFPNVPQDGTTLLVDFDACG